MRRNTAVAQQRALPLPRGWFMLGGALLSWALFAALWSSTMQVFGLVLSAPF